MQTTGADVRATRSRLGLSQEDLTALCGKTLSWLSKVEVGQRAVPWYLPLLLGLLQRDRRAIPLLLERRARGASAPAYFSSIVFLIGRSDDAAAVGWLQRRLK